MGKIFGALDPCRKLSLLKTEETLRAVKPKLRRLESDEEDLKNKGVRNWTRKSQDRELWRQFWKRLRFTKNCNPGRVRRTKNVCNTLRNRYTSREYK
jgi:hypothetical protein